MGSVKVTEATRDRLPVYYALLHPSTPYQIPWEGDLICQWGFHPTLNIKSPNTYQHVEKFKVWDPGLNIEKFPSNGVDGLFGTIRRLSPCGNSGISQFLTFTLRDSLEVLHIYWWRVLPVQVSHNLQGIQKATCPFGWPSPSEDYL